MVKNTTQYPNIWVSHVPVFDNAAAYQTGESSTRKFNNIIDSHRPVESPGTMTK